MLAKLLGVDIAKWEAERNISALIQAVSHWDKEIACAAAQAVGRCGDPAAMPALLAAFQDSDSALRQAAIEAVVKIGPPAIPYLIAATESTNFMHLLVAPAVQAALIQIGPPVIAPLIAAMRQLPFKNLSLEAVLEALGRPAIAPLSEWALDKQSPEMSRQRAIRILARLGALAIPALAAALQDSTVRLVALRALTQIDDSGVIEPLVGVLKCNDDKIQSLAAQALARHGWQPELDETGARYWIAVRQYAQCLAIGAPAVGPLVAALDMLDSPYDVEELEMVIQTLAQLGDGRACAPLRALLARRPDIRPTIEAALQSLGEKTDG